MDYKIICININTNTVFSLLWASFHKRHKLSIVFYLNWIFVLGMTWWGGDSKWKWEREREREYSWVVIVVIAISEIVMHIMSWWCELCFVYHIDNTYYCYSLVKYVSIDGI